jgi:HK97 family phage prohead protease
MTTAAASLSPVPRLKNAPAQFKLEAVSEEGVFSGFLAVYGNVDSYGDRILPGAFKASLREAAKKGRKFPILWQHKWDEVLGVIEEIEEREDGLYIKRGRLLIRDIPLAAQARALMLAEAITGMSIGFEVEPGGEKRGKDGINELSKLKLWEGSIVTFPANEEARIDTVKSALARGSLPTLHEFEGFLREAGFTKTQAKAIAGHGLSKLLRCEAGSENEQEKEQIGSVLSTLQAIKL